VRPSRSDRPPTKGHVRGPVPILIAHRAGDKAMTSSAAAPSSHQRGFRHELLLHRSTQELLELVVPMVREGVAAQEPTLLLVRPDTAEAVLHHVGPSPYLNAVKLGSSRAPSAPHQYLKTTRRVADEMGFQNRLPRYSLRCGEWCEEFHSGVGSLDRSSEYRSAGRSDPS
jgi:hypothetical protein